MYTILKPESGKYIYTIEEMLSKNSFDITSRHFINDWKLVAEKLYQPQREKSEIFAAEFNCYMWLTQHFFGNSAAVLILQRDGNPEENLRKLDGLKPEIRKIFEDNDKKISLFIKVYELDIERRDKLGIEGRLSFERNGTLEINEEGWGGFFFKYIHFPDPDLKEYNREMRVLRKLGILKKKITKEKWELMKQMQTLIYPIKTPREKNE